MPVSLAYGAYASLIALAVIVAIYAALYIGGVLPGWWKRVKVRFWLSPAKEREELRDAIESVVFALDSVGRRMEEFEIRLTALEEGKDG